VLTAWIWSFSWSNPPIRNSTTHFTPRTLPGLRKFKLNKFRIKLLKKWNSKFFLRHRISTVQEWKRNEMKMVEDYCWAITRAIGRSCSDQSSFWVLEFDLSWIPLCIHTRELPLAEISTRLSFLCSSKRRRKIRGKLITHTIIRLALSRQMFL
jgi:hypothetical protein